MSFYVYFLKDSSNKLYIGQTNNLQIKGWTRAKKKALIKGDLKLLKKL